MSSNESRVVRLIDRVFPRMPDFYGLIQEQCALCSELMTVFVQFMETGDPAKGAEVRELEKRGDELKARNSEILDKAFSTPMDREDILRAIVTIDQIMNYAKTTVREMEVLELKPDQYMTEMAILLQEGTDSLGAGFSKLSTDPAAAEQDAQAAHKAERRTEKVYRRALADLFNVDDIVQRLNDNEAGSKAQAMFTVIDIFKHRELYRHLSNGADQLAQAGDTLHDIIVKIA